jgi:hypothetical protein
MIEHTNPCKKGGDPQNPHKRDGEVPSSPDSEAPPARVPSIESAYLNLNTAKGDIARAQDNWEDGNYSESIQNCQFAVDQILSAITKMQAHLKLKEIKAEIAKMTGRLDLEEEKAQARQS